MLYCGFLQLESGALRVILKPACESKAVTILFLLCAIRVVRISGLYRVRFYYAPGRLSGKNVVLLETSFSQ